MSFTQKTLTIIGIFCGRFELKEKFRKHSSQHSFCIFLYHRFWFSQSFFVRFSGYSTTFPLFLKIQHLYIYLFMWNFTPFRKTTLSISPHIVFSLKFTDFLSSPPYFIKFSFSNALQIPTNQAIWYYTLTVTKNKALFSILTVLFHFVPALFMDAFLLLKGKKPRWENFF